MDQTAELREVAISLGASFFGVADLIPASAEIHQQGGASVSQFSTAISIGVALPMAIVDCIGNQDDRVAFMSYRHHAYDVINPRLDAIASRLASRLQDRGVRAFPVAASQTIDSANHLGAFSHKLAAHLSGLGWIGKSCLLVTPEAGPRVRWASVLTDAPLHPTGSPMAERCGSCTDCVDICPVAAFTGVSFREEDPRSARFDVWKCREHQVQLQKSTGNTLCGLCLYVCPHGCATQGSL